MDLKNNGELKQAAKSGKRDSSHKSFKFIRGPSTLFLPAKAGPLSLKEKKKTAT